MWMRPEAGETAPTAPPDADFIPEHQGTLKMGFFLPQAWNATPRSMKTSSATTVPVRSRETAILMMADGCEAALRSLPPDTSDAQAIDTVRRIVPTLRPLDGQLRKSGLGRAEVELVQQAFVRVWRRMRHRRIPTRFQRGRDHPAEGHRMRTRADAHR